MDSTGITKVGLTDLFNLLDLGRWLESGSTERLLSSMESQFLGGLLCGPTVLQGHRVTLSCSPRESLRKSIRNNSGRHNGIGGLHCEGKRTRAGNLLHNNQRLLGHSLHNNNNMQTLHLTI